MNVFCAGMIANLPLAVLRGVLRCDCVERCTQLGCLSLVKYSSCAKRRGVSLAGSYFLFKELPVKDN